MKGRLTARRWSRNSASWLGLALVFSIRALCWAADTEGPKPVYHLESAKPLSRFEPEQIALLEKLNRADFAHLAGMKHVIVPNRWDLDPLAYSPMPQSVPQLLDQRKALVVDIGAQVFGAYEFGELVRWGPVSSGGSSHETPNGNYNLNWNARIHRSTDNLDWVMPWYFNFSNDRGFGVHQYALPGRPASHGCVRMLDPDAQWVFEWGEGWTLSSDSISVAEYGTPVLIVGNYDFTKRPPWLKPGWWKLGVTLPDSEFDNLR